MDYIPNDRSLWVTSPDGKYRFDAAHIIDFITESSANMPAFKADSIESLDAFVRWTIEYHTEAGEHINPKLFPGIINIAQKMRRIVESMQYINNSNRP